MMYIWIGSVGTRYSHEVESDGVALVGSPCPAFRDEPKLNSQNGHRRGDCSLYLDTKLVGEIASKEGMDENRRRQVIPVTVRPKMG